MSWRWAAASAIGTSHIANGTRLQDAYSVEAMAGGTLFAIVCDGAGSASHGAQGAWLVCRHFKVKLRHWFARAAALPDETTLREWIDQIRLSLTQAAEKRSLVLRDFACTVVMLVADANGYIGLQIGDSAMVGRAEDDWRVLCWPCNGEYASTTFFITETPEPKVKFFQGADPFTDFALFTDGVGDLALSQAYQTPHRQFFDPMIRPVATADQNGRLVQLSEQLKAYLQSDRINDRTDDDKTLVLISRSA